MPCNHRPIALMDAPRFMIRKPVFQRVFGLITPVMRVFSVVTLRKTTATDATVNTGLIHAKKGCSMGKKTKNWKSFFFDH
jgi:hypothetical protein